jgi:N-methylhydantoinase B
MDPVRTEIMRNRFAAIAEEASNVAYRTAYTTFVKQTQDYQVAMASADGAFFAYPMKAGVTSSVCQNVRGAVDEIGIDTLVPGDVIITNDPFSGDALCTHTMDIHLLRPVFRDGRVIAFAWAFIHASDIGGAVPGSISPTSYEVFQEGVRLRPGLLYRAGALNAPLWHFFADNSRIPDLIWGDLQAMMAGLGLLDARLQELCDRYTMAGVLDAIADVLDLGELKARAALARLTPGRYEFSDYLEAYQDGDHVFIHAAMTVQEGGSVAVDFTGSDPAVRLAMNFVTGARAHPFLCMPLINFIQTMEPTTPVNGGIIRPISTFAPVGTLMNAEFPAAMGNRWVAVMRCYDVVLGCLNQALPDGLAACGSGQAGIISVAGVDGRNGRRHVSVVEPFIGGSGGRRDADGLDGIDQPVAFLRSAPAEVVETETQLVLRRFSYEPDSAAPGRHRGGHAMRIELENRGLAATVTVRGLDRFRFQPYGVQGGMSGSAGSTVLNPGRPDERDIGKIDVLEMKQGDVLRMITPSGGGFGDPFLRDPAVVAEEVADGMLTPCAARERYGVVADAAETAALRAGQRVASAFTFGPARRALEETWPEQASAALSAAMLAVPAGLRPFRLAALRARLAGTGPVTIEAVRTAIAEE